MKLCHLRWDSLVAVAPIVVRPLESASKHLNSTNCFIARQYYPVYQSRLCQYVNRYSINSPPPRRTSRDRKLNTLEGPTEFKRNFAWWGGAIANLISPPFLYYNVSTYKIPAITYPNDTIFEDNGNFVSQYIVCREGQDNMLNAEGRA